jgi:hypothetical protein
MLSDVKTQALILLTFLRLKGKKPLMISNPQGLLADLN